MGTFFLLAKAEPGAADNNFQLVAHVDADKLVDAEGAGHAVNNGEHVGAEVRLQRRVLVEVVENDLGDGVALQGDDDAHADTGGGLVLDVGDATDAPVGNLLGDGGHQIVGVHLVGQFGDDDDSALALFLDGGFAAHADGAAPGGVGVLDTLVANDEAGGGEVGAFDALHDCL